METGKIYQANIFRDLTTPTEIMQTYKPITYIFSDEKNT